MSTECYPSRLTGGGGLESRIPVTSPSVLRRWGSLRVRGEKRGLQGACRPAAVAVCRPSATTDSRHSGAPARAVSDSPGRNRSLSLSLSSPASSVSNNRLPSPRSPSVITRTPPTSPETPLSQQHQHSNHHHPHHNHHQHGLYVRDRDWDTASVTSLASGLSVASCDHASVARNGTTFSGRSMKYVVHCSQHAGATGEDYLTPTQRAHRQVKKLKTLLLQAQQDLEQKDSDIFRLTKEVVELRLYKAALSSPEDKSNSSDVDVVTVRENTCEEDVEVHGEICDDSVDGSVIMSNHHGGDMQSSFADSGHFEDMTNSSVHSKDSVHLAQLDDFANSSPCSKPRTPVPTADKAISANFGPREPDDEHVRLVAEYEKRIQEIVRVHGEESHQLKQKHNDKVEELLQRLTDVNTKYWQLVPDLDAAKDRIKDLEQQLEKLSTELQEQESKSKAYLDMCNSTHSAHSAHESESEILSECEQVLDLSQKSPSRVSVPELLQQLQKTQTELENIRDLDYASEFPNRAQTLLSAKEAVSLWVLGARKAMYKQLVEARSESSKMDPEITLQFLKSAIYYFLTDRENNHGHLRAIQSILGFTPTEVTNIDKARTS